MHHWGNGDFLFAVPISLLWSCCKDDERTPNVLIFSQLASWQRTVGWLWISYKEKLKNNHSALNVSHTNLEQVALDRNNWRLCQSRIRNFETSRIDIARGKRQQWKAPANILVPICRDQRCCGIWTCMHVTSGLNLMHTAQK